MQSKIIEIRDRGTRIDAIATKMLGENSIESYYLQASGFSNRPTQVILTKINGDIETKVSPYDWGVLPRTMYEAHKFISENFDDIPNYWTVDVETILGEKDTMKVPERYFTKLHSKSNIKFKLKEHIELAHVNSVRDILASEYNLEVVDLDIKNTSLDDSNVLVTVGLESVINLGLRFYEVLNEYLVCI